MRKNADFRKRLTRLIQTDIRHPLCLVRTTCAGMIPYIGSVCCKAPLAIPDGIVGVLTTMPGRDPAPGSAACYLCEGTGAGWDWYDLWCREPGYGSGRTNPVVDRWGFWHLSVLRACLHAVRVRRAAASGRRVRSFKSRAKSGPNAAILPYGMGIIQ